MKILEYSERKMKNYKENNLISVGKFLVFLVGTLISITPAAYADTQSSLAKYDPVFSNACGPVNLYLAFRLLGKDIKFEDVLSQCDTDKTGMTSLYKLETTAENSGLSTLCVKMNINTLKCLDDIAILHFVKPREHFVLFTGWVNKKCRILDATRKKNKDFVSYLDTKELKDAWDGDSVILSRKLISLPRHLNTGNTIGLGIIAGGVLIFLWAIVVEIGRCLIQQSK